MPAQRSPRRFDPFAGLGDITDIVERFNLRRVYYWLLLAGLVGVVGGLGALGFKWLTDQVLELFWGLFIGHAPATAGGEPSEITVHGDLRTWALILAPAIGGLLSALLVYRFAPEAEGHGTDAAIRAYHRNRGVIRARIPIVKILASALTLGSGGSAGREGPIAQIGAGFGSLLGTTLKLSDRERRILLAAGVSAGIGAIFRAPLAGAIFAAEVLYREPDIEAEVVVPALLSSIVSYSIYCAVHGFGHLFTGTESFTFHDPRALLCYAVLGLVAAFGGITFVKIFDGTTALFKRWKITNYAKPAIGGALTGMIGLAGYLISRDTGALAVMGSGYGMLQGGVSEMSALGPSLGILSFVAFGKMVTSSLTIGSGGSGGVFGPSMVIGGCLGAVVGTMFHAWFPDVVPNVGPFTIVGMAGFFAGVAKAPISTLLMVGDLTGNYSLLLPSMLVVGISMIMVHRWTIYPEAVATRADSPAHKGEFLHDVLSDLRIASVYDAKRATRSLSPATPLDDVLQLVSETTQHSFPLVDAEGRLVGTFSLDEVRQVLQEQDVVRDLIVAQDLATSDAPTVGPDDTVQRALDLLTIRQLDELPVVDEEGRLLGVVDRSDIMLGYTRRLAELRKG
ncbi:MAG: chloride channel protein [Kofleriaceae bacterium]|nr:chloride channel protein [Myxococcales bacterium]MCB9563761.1 chloride channel protein [Kofleriaceae bacterium]